LILFLSLASVQAKPYLPADTEVLAQINSSKKLKKLNASLKQDPNNIDLAYLLAKQYIALGKAQGDPRYYSYATASLAPWAKQKKSPPSIKLLLADIKQYQHRFNEALELLDAILLAESNYQEAILMRAAIYTELGKYSRSDDDCRQLKDRSLETTCLALNKFHNGYPAEAYDDLRDLSFGDDQASLWSLTILAEITARLAKTVEAERYYQQALAINNSDIYLLGSYADFLLDQAENQAVIDLLEGMEEVESLALRYRMAQGVNHD
jgi:Tfp pilus assembly protein PilF